MSEIITLQFTKREVEKLLQLLQFSIAQELEFIQCHKHEPDSEPFVIFLESIQEQTDLYIKLAEALPHEET